MALGNYKEAEKDFTISIRVDDMVQESMLNRGICRRMNNRFDQGVRDIRTAARMDDDEEIKMQAVQLICNIENSDEFEHSVDGGLNIESVKRKR
jgi:hypothetical protein